MVKKFDDIKTSSIVEIAQKMAIAAKTAPKARGTDNLEILILTGSDINDLANKMKDIAERDQVSFFKRDAENILQASAILLIGTRYKALELKNCGWCGWKSCEEKEKHSNHPCVYNLNDLGIALGSAVSIAADHRIDNRIMFSIGKAALEFNWFSSDIKAAFGIPLSATNKNPFFDRKPI
ncbi:MAG: DUF2148 domain-containing protein [Bacteroidales bacterium]|nr:DUF2148 domain-containing protein [Bacteroidales bacterium]